MRTPYLLLVALLLGHCAEPPPERSPLELLCKPTEHAPQYADFFWDELRRREPESFARAHEICTRRCPQSSNCGPVLSVARWYSEPPDLTPTTPGSDE